MKIEPRKLIDLKEKAESGDILAMQQLFCIYSSNKKNFDLDKTKYYGLKLSSFYPQNLLLHSDKTKNLCYAGLFYCLGDLHLDLKQYKEALKWLNKSKKEAIKAYESRSAKRFNEKYNIEELIKIAKMGIVNNRFYWLKNFRNELILHLFWKSYTNKLQELVSK